MHLAKPSRPSRQPPESQSCATRAQVQQGEHSHQQNQKVPLSTERMLSREHLGSPTGTFATSFLQLTTKNNLEANQEEAC